MVILFIYSAFADEISPDLNVQMNELKKYNIRHIEARGINGKNISEYTPSEAKEIKKILDENGFLFSALGSPIGKIKITDNLEPELDRFKRLLELCAIFETRYIRMFSFFMESEKADVYRDEVLERWQKYIKAAKGSNIILLHENEKGIYGDTAIRCLDLLKTLDCDYVKATFDPANFVQCKVNTLEAFDMLKDYIEYMHIKDAVWENGEVVPAGEGEGDILTFYRNREDERKFNAHWKGGFGNPEVWKCEVPTDGKNEQHIGIFKNIVDVLEKGAEPLATGEEGIKGLSISNAIHLSAWTEDWVEPEKIDEDLFYNMLQDKILNSKFKKKVSSDKTLEVGGTH